MIRKLATSLLVVGALNTVLAQVPATINLTIDLANVVEYRGDITDITKFARNAGITPTAEVGNGPTQTPNFALNTLIGDIVAVNGQPAKGLFAARGRAVGANTNPAPGQAIADANRMAIRENVFEILRADGTPIGTIMTVGMSGGTAPPGQPSTEVGNWAIVGGTGAFLGARGQAEASSGSGRAASMAEDPSYRRINGGLPQRYFVHIIPMTTPEVVVTADGPAVTHSTDFSIVSASKPAAAGETLSLFATGLGPVVPGLQPGAPFPSNPLATVNSPVTVMVNGKAAEVLAAVGYPGSVDGYQVNFQLPSDVAKGKVEIQLSAAWITGRPVSIIVQ